MITSTETLSASARPSATRLGHPLAASVLRDHCQTLLAGVGWPSHASTPASLRTLGLTSACRGEGVSTVTAHLALTAIGAGQRRVAVVNLDGHRSTLEQFFHASRAPGLAEFLTHQARLSDIVQETSVSDLSFVAAGGPLAPQAIAAHASRLPEVLESLQERFDLVLLDIPAVTASGIPFICAGLLDGVVLVVEAERVQWEIAQRAKSLLTRAGANLLGVVLNKHREHVPKWLDRAR